MRTTGFILAIVGLIGGIFCVAQLIMPHGPDRDVPMIGAHSTRQLSLVIPFAVCGGALAVGLLMLYLGGRSYTVSNNPRMRN